MISFCCPADPWRKFVYFPVLILACSYLIVCQNVQRFRSPCAEFSLKKHKNTFKILSFLSAKTVRETNAHPLVNASAFWAGRVENCGILYRTYKGHLFSGECSKILFFHTVRLCSSQLKSFFIEDIYLFILQGQYFGCWWLGDSRNQGTSSHDINLVILV